MRSKNICQSSSLSVSENEVIFPVRAKYIPEADGGYRLASIQRFSIPKFRKAGYELCTSDDAVDVSVDVIESDTVDETARELKRDAADVIRAIKRAQNNAFDIILSNPDLDTFATFTYSPESVSDKADYNECYKRLSVWLSNRVQRRGLKYVIVPEYTKKGDIHFHAICNSSALTLTEARSAKTGRKLTHNGKPLFNVSDWSFGFTSAEIIGAEKSDRDGVAKYIFKYMRKQMGQKIGGRYCLIGGEINRPIYLYGLTPEEFFIDEPCKFDKHIELDCGLSFDEWSYI